MIGKRRLFYNAMHFIHTTPVDLNYYGSHVSLYRLICSLPTRYSYLYESETRKNCAQGTVWNTLVIEDNQWYRWEPRRQLLGASGTGKKHDGFNLHRHESIFLSIRPSLVLVYVGIFNLLSFKNFMSSH